VQELSRFSTGVPTKLHRSFDIAVHRALSFSIISQSSVGNCKDASQQVNRESCRDAKNKVLILTDTAVQVLTPCRIGTSFQRYMFPDVSEE
jgi:hypothetical protein